jgi:polysaccharide chain length determinant protein (PEP-CTERM system associated)
MPRRPITNPLEYLQIGVRRWVWLLVPLVVIGAATAVVARHLPKLYSSEALILVEPQKVPADFVKPTVSSNVALRLTSIQEQILSRTQLGELVNRYALYRDQNLTPDQKISQMLDHITVTPSLAEPDRPNSTVTAFRISFEAPTPLLAQGVTRDLSNLFITENLKARADQSQGTVQFIDGQLNLAQQTMDGLETQLRELRSQYMGSLPEQQNANLQVMSQLNSQLQANAEGLARAQQQRTYLTSLGQAVATLGSPGAALGTPPALTPDEQALNKAQSNLAVAQQMYTPQHPDVIRLQAQVKALTQQVAQEKADAAAAKKETAKAAAPQAAGNPKATAKPKATVPDDLAELPPQQRSQVTLLDQEIAQRQADQKTIQGKINTLQGRIEALPEVEQKLANITNAASQAKASYNSLLDKKAAAATAAAMEQQAEGEEFRIIDPANLPLKPTSPDLVRIEIMGGLGGLLFGCGLAFMAEMRDPVVRSETDITFYTQAPLLAALPLLPPVLALTAAPEDAGAPAPVSKA